MSTIEPHMDRRHLCSLLAQVGSMAQESPEFPSAENFDWRQCRYFGTAVFEDLRQAVSKSLQDMAARVGVECQDEFIIELKGLEQQYGHGPLAQVSAMTSGDYGLTFGLDEETLEALLIMPSQSAWQWANFALGASSDEGGDGNDSLLSALEETFLTDLSRSMVQALAPLCQMEQMATDAAVNNGPAEVPWQDVDALLSLTFEVKKVDAEKGSEGRVFLPCSMIAMDRSEDEEMGGEEDEVDVDAIVKHCLQDYPIPIQVLFGTLEMSFEELASLEPNDILMLDRRIDEPVEIQVGKQRAFAGLPAQRRGQKVVMITQAYCQK